MNKTHPLRTPPSPLLYTCPFMRHTLSSASPLNCQLVACLPHLFHPTLNYHPLDCLLPPSFPSIHIIPLKLTPFSTAILFDCLPPPPPPLPPLHCTAGAPAPRVHRVGTRYVLPALPRGQRVLRPRVPVPGARGHADTGGAARTQGRTPVDPSGCSRVPGCGLIEEGVTQVPPAPWKVHLIWDRRQPCSWVRTNRGRPAKVSPRCHQRLF